MTDPAIVLIGDYDGSISAYCTICHPPEDQGAILTIQQWPGSVPLAEVLEVAAQHQHQHQGPAWTLPTSKPQAHG